MNATSYKSCDAPMERIFALPLRLGSGTRNEAPIFDHHGELRAECVDSDCDERALAVVRAVNSYDDMLAALLRTQAWIGNMRDDTGMKAQIDAAIAKAVRS